MYMPKEEDLSPTTKVCPEHVHEWPQETVYKSQQGLIVQQMHKANLALDEGRTPTNSNEGRCKSSCYPRTCCLPITLERQPP